VETLGQHIVDIIASYPYGTCWFLLVTNVVLWSRVAHGLLTIRQR
jgi:hypothetical protein